MIEPFFWKEFDNDGLLLSFCSPCGYPYWYDVRESVLNGILANILLEGNDKTIVSSIRNKKRVASYLVHSFLHRNNDQILKDASSIFIVPSRYTDVNNSQYNLFSDYYAVNCLSSFAIIEHAPTNFIWAHNRALQGRIFDDSIWLTIAEIRSSNADFGKEHQVLKQFNLYLVKKIEAAFSFPKNSLVPKKIVSEALHQRRFSKNYSKLFFKHTTNRVTNIYIVGGFRSRYSFFIREAKKRNIYVAEIQHGLFNDNDFQYNATEALNNDGDFKNGIPDGFLLFGEYWKERCSFHIDKITIGSPRREEAVKALMPRDKYIILLVGCCHETASYLKFAEEISRAFPQYKVVFRPHPNELDCVADISSFGFEVDLGDLYSMLNSSILVISEFSTVLFEALGVAKIVALWNTNYSHLRMQDRPFPEVTDIDSIRQLINSSFTEKSYKQQKVWSNNWKENFINYLEKSNTYCDR